jgi:hypothetical protein
MNSSWIQLVPEPHQFDRVVGVAFFQQTEAPTSAAHCRRRSCIVSYVETMFVLLIAGDLYGRKHNLEIGFPDLPALDELGGHAEAVFRNEARRLRPANSALHRFTLDNIKIFDDSLNRWLDLTSTSQLVEWSQLYLVQPEGAEDDGQAILEAPIRVRSPVEAGSDKEKFFFLFHDMDFNGNGHLSREEVQRIFNIMCLYKYGERTIDEFFHKFDTNRDGVLSYAEFAKWMSAHPDIAEDLLKKSVEYWDAWRRRPVELRDSAQITAQERDAILQYLDRGRSINEEMRRREAESRRIQDEQHLREREAEISNAKARFTKKYGREPVGTPSPVRPTSGRK